jgi:hypothetical protein
VTTDQDRHRRAGAVLLGLAIAGSAAIVAIGQPSPPPPDMAAACGGCHQVPPADVLPRSVWRDEVIRMQRIRDGSESRSTPSTTLPADFEGALASYLARAPVALARPADWPAASAQWLVTRGLSPPGAPPTPVVSDVQLADLDGDARLELVVCDMRHGMVLLGRPYERHVREAQAPPPPELTLVANVPHPSRAQVADVDGDGVRDLLVADLGEFLPRDHDMGAVVWLRGLGGGRFAPFAIGGLPRVASVEAADLDGDGDMDLIVAAFGYRKTGRVLVLENRTTNWAKPAFAPVVLDARPGAVRALATDVNGDGRLDVVAVVSQEHEEVVAYIRGDGLSFTPTVLWKAPHANWGSSGLSLADLDADGDLDLLLANGDTFDDSLLKPYHGLAWLERTSGRTGPPVFAYRRLADLPGPHGIVASDLDGDGDLDVVGSALIAGGAGDDDARLPGLVWMEQVSRGRFERRTLKRGMPRHAALAAGDYDRDGDVDLVTGNMATTGLMSTWIDLWENRRK